MVAPLRQRLRHDLARTSFLVLLGRPAYLLLARQPLLDPPAHLPSPHPSAPAFVNRPALGERPPGPRRRLPVGHRVDDSSRGARGRARQASVAASRSSWRCRPLRWVRRSTCLASTLTSARTRTSSAARWTAGLLLPAETICLSRAGLVLSRARPRLADRGKKSLATGAARGGRFVPGGGAPSGRDTARLGVTRRGGSAATGAGSQGLRDGLMGLALEGLVEHGAAPVVAEQLGPLLPRRAGGAPGRAFRPVQVVQHVVGRCLQNGTQGGRNLYRLGRFCHRELLSVVAQEVEGEFACRIVQADRPARKPCRAPPLAGTYPVGLHASPPRGYNLAGWASGEFAGRFGVPNWFCSRSQVL